MTSKTLTLIRHGETEWNAIGKYTGQTDIPINERGRQQARAVAEELKNDPPEIIYSSDLIRANETAEIISKKVEADLVIDTRLREIHQGKWEGLHLSEIKNLYEEEWKERQQDPFRVAPPGGETIGEVRERVMDFIQDEILNSKYKHIAIVAHGIILSMIKIITEELPMEKIWERIPPNAKAERVLLKGKFIHEN